MKILYVMPNILHPTVRGELRHYYLLKCLAMEHEITLVALNRKDVPPEVLDELRQRTRLLVRVGTPAPSEPTGSGLAGILARLRWKVRKTRLFRRDLAEMKQRVERLLHGGGFDVLLLAGSDLYRIAESNPDAPMVVDWCDTDSPRLRRALRHASPLEWPLRFLHYSHIHRIERRVFRKLRHVTFISRRDRDAATAAVHKGTVIPNGCDLDYWTRGNAPRRERIVFSGVMDYAPNADAARYLLSTIAPLVREQIPHVEFVIAGHNPSPEVLALARKSEGVVVTGTVPDLRPYLESAAVFVAPLRFASGMQNKIIEAMAMELPVVTTPVVAEGFSDGGPDEPPLLVGEQPRELAAHLTTVVRDPLKASRLGAAGRRYVRRHCDWGRSARMLDCLCREVALAARRLERSHDVGGRRHPGTHSTRSKDRVFHSLV